MPLIAADEPKNEKKTTKLKMERGGYTYMVDATRRHDRQNMYSVQTD
jgi:hypothetical protein